MREKTPPKKTQIFVLKGTKSDVKFLGGGWGHIFSFLLFLKSSYFLFWEKSGNPVFVGALNLFFFDWIYLLIVHKIK